MSFIAFQILFHTYYVNKTNLILMLLTKLTKRRKSYTEFKIPKLNKSLIGQHMGIYYNNRYFKYYINPYARDPLIQRKISKYFLNNNKKKWSEKIEKSKSSKNVIFCKIST